MLEAVRDNLLKRLGYTPYCGAPKCPLHWPRSHFDGEQFKCRCGWRSQYESDFIEQYKNAQRELYERGEQPENGCL